MANLLKLGQFGHTFKRGAAIVRSVQERYHPPGESSEKIWRNLSILGLPVLLLAMYNCFVLHKEDHIQRPEPTEYPYLKMMKKPFPWGDGKHSLFHNPKHNWIPGIGYEE